MKRAAGLLALTLLAAGVGVGQVTTSNEQHVLLVGDSIMRQTGDALDHQLGDGWRIHNDGVNGSGLLTPDYFDWSDILEQDLARTDPDVVVFLFIGNYTDDPSELWQADDGSTVDDVSSPAFAREWGQEVDAAMATIAEASDAEVVMVLPPPMATPELQGVADALRREYRRAADALAVHPSRRHGPRPGRPRRRVGGVQGDRGRGRPARADGRRRPPRPSGPAPVGPGDRRGRRGSGLVDLQLGRLHGGPDRVARREAQVGDGGRGDLGHQRYRPGQGHPHPIPDGLEVVDRRRPRVAGAAVGPGPVEGDRRGAAR